MKNIDVQWINIPEDTKRHNQPVYLIERPRCGAANRAANGGVFGSSTVARVGTFWTPADLSAVDIRWHVTDQGDHVRVPIYAYRTELRAKCQLLSWGLTLGLRAAWTLRSHTPCEVAKALLLVGAAVHSAGSQYRCYIGMTFQLQD